MKVHWNGLGDCAQLGEVCVHLETPVRPLTQPLWLFSLMLHLHNIFQGYSLMSLNVPRVFSDFVISKCDEKYSTCQMHIKSTVWCLDSVSCRVNLESKHFPIISKLLPGYAYASFCKKHCNLAPSTLANSHEGKGFIVSIRINSCKARRSLSYH